MELVWVTKAIYEGEYRLRLTFSDGKSGIVDLAPYTLLDCFSPLKDLDTFQQFSVNDWTVSWLDGKLDIAPESLYRQAVGVELGNSASDV